MVAPSWGCRKQNKFLDSREDDFLQAQEDGTVGRVFWPTLTRDFLAIWPDQETENADWEREAEEDKKKAAEEEKNADTSKRKRKKKGKKERVPPVFASHADWEKDRIKKIHSWYYNHTSPSRKPKPAVTLTVNAAPVLGCKGLTEEQLYSKKFYLERVKPLVDAQLAVSAVNPKDQMAIRARITRECYEREPEELKEEIRREKQHEEKKRRDTIEMLQNLTRAEDEKDPSPEEYARYQGAAADLVVCFFEALAARTGWAWTVLGGGPHSDKINGANGVVSYHIGASPDGLKFSGAVESFDELIAVPFGKYCHRVFPEEVRLRRAIKIGADMAGREALKRAGRGIGTMVHVGDHTKTETEKADGGAMGQKTDESRHEGVENDEGVESEGVDCPVDGGAEGQEVDQPVNEPIGDKEGQGVDLPPSTWSMPQGGMTFPAEDWVKIMEKGEGDETVSNGEGFGESNGWGGGTVPNGDDPVLDRLLEMLPPISELVPHGIPPTAASEPNQLTFGDMGYQFGGFEEVVLPAGDKPVRSEEVVWPAGNTPGCLEGVGREIVGLVGFVSVPGQQDLEGGIRGKKRASEEGEAEAVDSRSASGREKHMRKGGNREVDDWVFLAEGYLRRGIDDVAWARCIDLWAKLERSALSRNSRLAESGLRPIELSKWVASRKWDSDPVVEDLLDYAQRWIAWWRAMQPACRKVEGRELPNELDDQMRKDVVSLKKAGANGLVVLLVGLKWWAPLRTDDWRWGAVVKDFVQCLEIFVG